MSDDLLRRLREGTNGTDVTKTDAVLTAYMREAADRIEELEAKLAEVEAERDRQYDENVHRIVKEAEAEAKLAKLARAAKPFAAIKIKDGRSQPGEIGRTDVTNLRAALAELKGEDRG